MSLIEVVIVVLLLLWALGFFAAPMAVGSLIHVLLAVVLVLIIIRMVQGRPPLG